MTRCCPAGITVTTDTKRRFMCQDVHRKPQPSSLAFCVQPFSLGSDWRRPCKDNPAQNPPLSISPIKGLEQFQRSFGAVFSERYLHSGPAFACAQSLHWALSRECQTLKALAEICGDSVYYFLFHSSKVLWFWDSMNKKRTKVTFRQKWGINHDRKI